VIKLVYATLFPTHTHPHTTPPPLPLPLPLSQLQETNKELELLLMAAEAMGGDSGGGGGAASHAGAVVHDALYLASPSKSGGRGRTRPRPTSANPEDSPTSSPGAKRRQQLASSQIGTTLSARIAIDSGSFSRVSNELTLQSEFVQALRLKNADLLYKLQVASTAHALTAF